MKLNLLLVVTTVLLGLVSVGLAKKCRVNPRDIAPKPDHSKDNENKDPKNVEFDWWNPEDVKYKLRCEDATKLDKADKNNKGDTEGDSVEQLVQKAGPALSAKFKAYAKDKKHEFVLGAINHIRRCAYKQGNVEEIAFNVGFNLKRNPCNQNNKHCQRYKQSSAWAKFSCHGVFAPGAVYFDEKTCKYDNLMGGNVN